MSKNKLKIGEFSRLGRVTVRALRHYEDIGLLVPEIIDRETGYRYYAVSQLQKVQSITTLKSLGYSLEEIRNLWEDDTHFPSVVSLEEKIKACEAELEMLKERKRMLKAVVASQKKLHKMEKIYFEKLPAITVASHRTIIPSYDDLGRLCCEVIGPEMARLGCECPEPGYCYTIEHGGYKPQDIDIEYCEKVSAKGAGSSIIKFKDIPEVPLAACMKVFGPYDRLYQSYVDLFAWLEKEGYRTSGDPRACYVDGIWNQEDPDKWLTIIQVPVSK
ncbi:MAG: MerR family transcriptional regulator [Bacteroidia bacterium]|nr:MerR family transcriptional regulator [Bacteroidia bacterium]